MCLCVILCKILYDIVVSAAVYILYLPAFNIMLCIACRLYLGIIAWSRLCICNSFVCCIAAWRYVLFASCYICCCFACCCMVVQVVPCMCCSVVLIIFPYWALCWQWTMAIAHVGWMFLRPCCKFRRVARPILLFPIFYSVLLWSRSNLHVFEKRRSGTKIRTEH